MGTTSQDIRLAEKLLADGAEHRAAGRQLLAEACFREAALKTPDNPDAKLALHSITQDPGLLEELHRCGREFTPLVKQLNIHSLYRPFGYATVRLDCRADVRRAYALQVAREGNTAEALAVMAASTQDAMDLGTTARIALEGGLKYADVLEGSLELINVCPDELIGDLTLMVGWACLLNADFDNARRHLQSARALIDTPGGKEECDVFLAEVQKEAEACMQMDAQTEPADLDDAVHAYEIDRQFDAIIEHNFGGQDSWPDVDGKL